MALVLETGLRADRRAAEAFVASPPLQRHTFADYQQRIDMLLLYNRPLASAGVDCFRRSLKATLLPRLAYVSAHACAQHSAVCDWRRLRA